MSCTPTLAQSAFRLRNDDGSETTATWRANENANATIAVDENFRVRFVVQVTNACAASNKTFQLEYRLDTGSGFGSWTTVNGSSSVVRSTASPNVADAANTTDQMTAGSGTFQGATAFDEVDGLCGGPSLDIAASGHSQPEFCAQIRSADVANGNTIELRVSSTNLASWTSTPSITVQEASTTTLTASKGSLSLTAKTAVEQIGFSIAKNTLTLAAKTATLKAFVNLIASKGLISLSGGSASFSETFVADKNTLTLSGQDATLGQLLAMIADKGSLALAGKTSLFSETFALSKSTLTLAGKDATFQIAVVLVANKGLLVLSGKEAAFMNQLSATKGTLVITGDDAAFVTALLGAKGSLVLTGKDATFVGGPPVPSAYRKFEIPPKFRRSWTG